MANFNFEFKTEDQERVLYISGHIDEDVTFNDILIEGSGDLYIDFKGIQSINSCGIREWIKWITPVSEGNSIRFKNCPKIIVDQINMVSGFLPKNAKVRSFYVPYYCEETDVEKMILFSEGQEYSDGVVNAPSEIQDEQTGKEMEMDVIEGKYFKFLNLKAG